MQEKIKLTSTFQTADPALLKKAVTQKVEKLVNIRIKKQTAGT